MCLLYINDNRVQHLYIAICVYRDSPFRRIFVLFCAEVYRGVICWWRSSGFVEGGWRGRRVHTRKRASCRGDACFRVYTECCVPGHVLARHSVCQGSGSRRDLSCLSFPSVGKRACCYASVLYACVTYILNIPRNTNYKRNIYIYLVGAEIY